MKLKSIILYICCCFVFLAACGTDTEEDTTKTNLREDINANDVSSQSTDIPSKNFPHTRAVQVQEAKFEFEVTKGGDGKDLITKRPGKHDSGEKNWNPWGKGDEAGTDAGRGGGMRQGKEQANNDSDGESWQAEQEKTPQREGTDQGQAEQQQDEDQEQDAGEQNQQTEGISDAEQSVIDLTNQERRNNGLSELEAHAKLSNVARTKSTEMEEENYFSHTSPNYGSPFDMIRDFDVNYSSAAENIAQGQPTPEQVVQSWMDSEGHRANILNGDFTHIGVGYEVTGHHWTQMFITK